MVRAVDQLVDAQRPLKVGPRPRQVPQVLQSATQIVQNNPHEALMGVVGLFKDQQRPLEVGPRSRQVSLLRENLAQVVHDCRDPGVVGAEEILADLRADGGHGGMSEQMEMADAMTGQSGDMAAMDMMSGQSGETAAIDMMSGQSGAMPMGGMEMDLNDVEFDAYLANDRTLADPDVVRVAPGGRLRLRIINAAASTNFWLGLGGLEGSLIAVDGLPVEPVAGKRFPIAIAQRLDIRLTLPAGQGAYPITAHRECTA